MSAGLEGIIEGFEKGQASVDMKKVSARDDLHDEGSVLDHAVMAARLSIGLRPDCAVSLIASLYHDVFKAYGNPEEPGFPGHEVYGMNWVRRHIRKYVGLLSPPERFFLYQMLENHAVASIRRDVLERICGQMTGPPKIFLDFLRANCSGRVVPKSGERTIKARLKTIDAVQAAVGEGAQAESFRHTHCPLGVVGILEGMARKDPRQILIVYVAPPANSCGELLEAMTGKDMDVQWESMDDVRLDLIRGRSNQVWNMALSDQYRFASREVSGSNWWPVLNARIQTRIIRTVRRYILLGGHNSRSSGRRGALKVDPAKWMRVAVFEDAPLVEHVARNKRADPEKEQVFSPDALPRLYGRLELPTFAEFDRIIYMHRGF